MMMKFFSAVVLVSLMSHSATGEDQLVKEQKSLSEIKIAGASKSKYLLKGAEKSHDSVANEGNVAKIDLEGFRHDIEPILKQSCVVCHGEKKQKADLRIDQLDPDLVNGEDADYWLEVMEVMSNDEMPPEDEDVEIDEGDRGKVIDWLSGQILVASQAKRSQSAHSSFRRMTRYEFNYALQDLLKLPIDHASDLPPEAVSEDGFKNSSEVLQMTSLQFSTYRDLARKALQLATFKGAKPSPVYFGMTMEKADTPEYMEWLMKHHDYYEKEKAIEDKDSDILGRFKKAVDAAKSGKFSDKREHFLNKETGEAWNRSFPNGFYPWGPVESKPKVPEAQPYVLVLPHGEGHRIDLGNHLPDHGIMKIRVRASRASAEGDSYPSLALSFGYNPNNNSSREYVLSKKDVAITAIPSEPEFYEWLIDLSGIQRNPFLRTGVLGQRPSPNERVTIRNVHKGERHDGATVHIDYIEVIAPYITQWPPASHESIFPKAVMLDSEESRAHNILAKFMPKAWRREVSEKEIERKLRLFNKIRPTFDDFEDSMIEVLATVLSSPHFLYLSQSDGAISDAELASRLSFFLWSSQPDEELLEVVRRGKLREPGMMAKQAERMLDDPRAQRFSRNFTYQWLGLDSFDLLEVDRKMYPEFSSSLKASMKKEPLELFKYMLRENRSVMDFLHADYTMLNQNLANHYGIENVYGNHFQKVDLPQGPNRGGLLVQAGLLAMNSDGKDSHPLKRGIWLLENILHDPPPPAPPAVPEIDLTDPKIMQMTLKERMEDHRNKPACASCHSKIDPWGVAFENFDAIGRWRDEVNGKPVDATSLLYNKSKLNGVAGLKEFLLENRQDQFASAMVHKLGSYALGRPIGFSDHAEIEHMTAELRKKGDGLRTLLLLIVESELFQKN